jgi:large conductance mechanosensitive channel
MLSDFKKFILRGNAIELAVAFVVGAAFNGVVQSLVKDLLTPLIAAIGGKPNFSSYYFTINNSRFSYGDFINSLVSFIMIAAAVFFLVIHPINKLIEITSRLKTPPDPTDKKCPECLSTIPIGATRCAFCGIKLKPNK